MVGGVGGVGAWSGWLGLLRWSEVVGVVGVVIGGSEWSEGRRWSEMVGGSEMVRQVVVICQTSSESPWVHLSNHTQIKVAGTKELNLLAACTLLTVMPLHLCSTVLLPQTSVSCDPLTFSL